MSIFWTENYMVVDVVDTMIGLSFHRLIIPARPAYVNTIWEEFWEEGQREENRPSGDAPFIPPHEGVGFQGRLL